MPVKPSKIALKQKLRNLNPDKDCVAIFQPNEGVSFYIPDTFQKTVKDGEEIPPYVMAVLMHVHLYKYIDNPVVKEFAEKFKQQMYLDLTIDYDYDYDSERQN